MAIRPLTRRNFLKLVSATGGGLTGAWLLAGCGVKPEPEPAPTLPMAVAASPTRPATAETASLPPPSPTGTDSPTPTPLPLPGPETIPPVSDGSASIRLPAPRLDDPLPLMQALLARRSTRSFRPDELPAQVLADLLWAGFGVNRQQSGGRTAPSAYDFRDIDIYLATAKGLYRYAAELHALMPLLPDDLRAASGTQAYAAAAPLNLIYVSDYRRMNGTAAQLEQWSWAHNGFIAQNVYLYCAGAGLACVVRSTLDRESLARRMGLQSGQHVILAQSLGYPLL